MPFLRVVRDKRGYETTYLMHLYREGHRQRSKILYVFRSPGGVRVGRTALDPDVLREIEARYPDIAFDWKDVREHQQHIEMGAEPRRRRPPREDAPARPRAAPQEAAPQKAAPQEAAPQKAAPQDAAARESAQPAAVGETKAPRPPVPSGIEGATPDEQVAFLTYWYPLIRERVPRRTSDPVRQEALLALTERLNPAAWTDADEITAGLQQAGEALERLSRVFARRRRRARRGAGAPPPAAPAGPPAES